MHQSRRTQAHLSLLTLAVLGACTRTGSAPGTSAPTEQPTVRQESSLTAAKSNESVTAQASPAVERSRDQFADKSAVRPAAPMATVPASGTMGIGGGGGRAYAEAKTMHARPKSSMARPKREAEGSLKGPALDSALAIEERGSSDDRRTDAEKYAQVEANRAVDPTKDRLSTFAVDVDTASYALARRKLNEGSLPTPAGVRVEEFINSFDYGDEGPSNGTPFAIHTAIAPSPMNVGHHVMRVNLQAKRLHPEERRPVHLVYLVDVSGSMQAPDRIGLAKQSLHTLTERLGPKDTVALCTYAGSTREVLAPTGIARKADIHAAIDSLSAGGSTAMASGIDIAYALAARTHVKGDISHVVVLSDGDANVGSTSHDDILKRIAAHKSKGITLSTVGFGTGNYNDQMMEQLADKGDGNYSYIDSLEESDRVFGRDIDGLLQVIAKDTKVQVEFMPEVVTSYRLIGYENRDVADRDFRNDHVDAGEVGAGHSVTALYDLVLKRTDASPATVRLRYAPAEGGAVVELGQPVALSSIYAQLSAAPKPFQFSVAVAGFAENLRARGSAPWSLSAIEGLAKTSAPQSKQGNEFLRLLARAKQLRSKGTAVVASGDE